jgi:transposase
LAEQQARLASWRTAIGPACEQLLAEEVPLSVAAAFRRAGIPRTPRLFAPRLGLASVVARYAAFQADGVRERILAGWREGMPCQQLAQSIGVSLTLVRRVLARRPREPRGPVGRPRRIRGEQEGELRAQLAAHPTATVAVQARLWEESHGTTLDRSTMQDAIRRLGWRWTNER